MDVVVMIKQVPDTTDVRIDPETNTLVREGVESILNPYDQFALEVGVKIARKSMGRVTVISMGPPQARVAIRRCLALGADRGILLSDRKFAGSDTWSTSYTLSRAIRNMEDFDLILCGQQAIDGDTGQVGPEVAKLLEIPQVTYAESITMEGGNIVLNQQLEDGSRILESKPPLLVACMPPSSWIPRIPTIPAILKTRSSEIVTWTAGDIGGDPSEFGLEGSPTQVVKTYSPPPRGEVELLRGDARSQARKLTEIMKEKGLIGGVE
jgi:electron transfer flavoprotein beta subunit